MRLANRFCPDRSTTESRCFWPSCCETYRGFEAKPAEADKLIRTGIAPVPGDIPPVELAAWTSVARAVLNLHETITRN